jgi:DnaD/phage-associated family protein
MAERRMFAKAIVESDAFMEMPLSSQALYLHLNMNADDDGFVSSPKRIARMINANEDDLKVLLSKRFVLGFDNGIVVIKHWKMNNLIRKDRYKKTVYQDEFKMLDTKENNSYTELATNGQPMVNQMATQDSIGKVRLGKDSIGKVIVVYEQEIGHATPTTLDTLESYLDDVTEEMIIKAIQIASMNNKKNLAYVKGILNSWISKGYKVLSDTQEEQKKTAKTLIDEIWEEQ